MPNDALGELIKQVKQGEIDLNTAKDRATALEKTDDLRQSVQDALLVIDRAKSLDLEKDLAVTEVCRAAMTGFDDAEIEILVTHLLGRIYVQSGNPKAAVEHVARAEHLCRERADRQKLSAVMGTRAGLNFHLGKYAEALETYEETYDLALEFENKASAASSLLGKAHALTELGRSEEALEAYRSARRLYQIVGETFAEFQALKHIVELAGNGAAVGTLEDAVALGLSVGADDGQLIPLLAKLSQSHDREGRTTEADRDFETALDLARRSGNQELESVLLGNRGAHLAEAGRKTEAVTWLDRALRFSVEIGDAEGAEVAAKNLDAVYRKMIVRRLAGQEPAPQPTLDHQSETTTDTEKLVENGPPESAESNAKLSAIQRIVFGFVRTASDDAAAESIAERLGRVVASFTVGEMVEDPVPVMQDVGGDPLLRHFLSEILDNLASEEIDLAPAFRSALEAELATPYDDADCDLAIRDLTTRVERGLSSEKDAFECFEDIMPSELPRAACHIVAERIQVDAKAAEEAAPHRALLSAMGLCRWLPRHSPSTDRFQAAQLLGTLAQAFKAFDLSLRAWEHAARSADEGGRPTGVAGALTNLGSTLRRMGRAAEARHSYEAAIDAVEDLHDQPVVLAMTLMNAATAYSDLGEQDKARAACERAISLIPETSEHAESLIIAYTNLAGALNALGDEAGNEQATLTALTLARRHKVKTQEAVALGHLAQIKQRQGNFDDAIESYDTAVRIATDEGDRWNAQNFLRDLGNCFASLGLDMLAFERFERALDLARKVGDLRSVGFCLLGLGMTRGAEDIAKARDELNEALEIFKRIKNTGMAQKTAVALAQLALLEAVGFGEDAELADVGSTCSLGSVALKDPGALNVARRWMETAEEMSDRPAPDNAVSLDFLRARILLLEGDSEAAIALMKQLAAIKSNPLDTARASFSLASAIYRAAGDAEEALPWYQRGLDEYEAVIAKVPGSRARIEIGNRFVAFASDAVFCALDVGDLDTAFDICERARSAELRRLHKLRGRAAPLFSLAEVRKRLTPGTVLVELFPTLQGTIAIVIPQDDGSSPRSVLVPECGHKELGRAWVEEREAYERASSPIAAFDETIGDAWSESVAAFCGGLGRRLMDPIANELDDCITERVIIVPHSILLCFPLHAVILEDGHWLDRFDITFLASASSLATATECSPPPSPDAAIFFGIVDSLQDLRMAKIETNRAARRFGDRAVVVTGSGATRAAFAASASTADVIHIACHARQSLGAAGETAIYLWSDAEERVELLDLESLNRDFVLKPGAKVVLSACESGTAMPSLSSEVVSLAGGIMAAGAASVVSSFWRVGDAPSALLFERYYENLFVQGMEPASALRDAQLALRAMNEAEVHEALSAIITDQGHLEDPSYAEILAAFSAKRSDVRPFDNVVDWAAFFLLGAFIGPSTHLREASDVAT